MTPYATGKDWTLYDGECAAVMRDAIADESIDLVVTSPPYDPVYLIDGRLVTDCKNGQRDYQDYEWDFVEVATELWRIIRPGGAIVWVVGDKTVDGGETGTPERQKLFFMDLGFRCHDTMIFERWSRFPDVTRYWQNFEFMYVFSKGKPKSINRLTRKNIHAGKKATGRWRQKDGTFVPHNGGYYPDRGVRSNVWKYSVGQGHMGDDDLTHAHPARFPEALAHDHIISWSNPGDVVLDCFLGSGTTAKMALMTGRQTIGIDVSPEYLEIAKKRIALTRLPLFEQVEEELEPEQMPLALQETRWTLAR